MYWRLCGNMKNSQNNNVITVQPNNVSDDAVVGALPGEIIGEVEKLLAVEFCNGE